MIWAWEERANLSAFRTCFFFFFFFRFALVWFCLFPLPLGVWEGLRFVIVALPGLLSYPFLRKLVDNFWWYILPYFSISMFVVIQFSITLVGESILMYAQKYVRTIWYKCDYICSNWRLYNGAFYYNIIFIIFAIHNWNWCKWSCSNKAVKQTESHK